MDSKFISFGNALGDLIVGKIKPEMRYFATLETQWYHEFVPYAYECLGYYYWKINELRRVVKAFYLSIRIPGRIGCELRHTFQALGVRYYTEEVVYQKLVEDEKNN